MENQNVGPASGSVEANVPAGGVAVWRGAVAVLALPFRYLWITVAVCMTVFVYNVYQYDQALMFNGGADVLFGLSSGINGAYGPDQQYAALHWLAEPELHQSLVDWAKGALLAYTAASLLGVFGIFRFFWRKLRWVGVPVAFVVALLWSAWPANKGLVPTLTASVQDVNELRDPLYYVPIAYWGVSGSGGLSGMVTEVRDLIEGKPFSTSGMEYLEGEANSRGMRRTVVLFMQRHYSELPPEQWLAAHFEYQKALAASVGLTSQNPYERLFRGPYPFENQKAWMRKKWEEKPFWVRLFAIILLGTVGT